MIAMYKNENNERPIAIGNIYIICYLKQILRYLKPIIIEHFGGKQRCMDENGCEKIIKAIQLKFDLNKECVDPEKRCDIAVLDNQNAFNSVNRLLGLNEIRKHNTLKILLPAILKRYKKSSKLSFNTVDGVKQIIAESGVQQGDIIGTFFYGMAIHPLIKKLADIIGPENLIQFYVDDSNFAAPFDKMILVIDAIIEYGPEYGFFLNFDKGSYVLAECPSTEEAIRRQDILVSKGFKRDLIHIHSSNGGDPLKYGGIVLGAKFGDPPFIKNQLQKEIDENSRITQQIIEYDCNHLKNILIRSCFIPKINYLSRVQYSNDSEQLLLSFENNKKLLLGSSVSVHGIYPLSEESYSLAQLDYDKGGLSYQDSIITQKAAHIASLLDTKEELLKLFPNLEDLLINPLPSYTMLNDFNNAVQSIKAIDNSFNPSELTYIRGCSTQNQISDILKKNKQHQYINTLQDPKQLAFYHSCCDDKSSKAFFQSIPNGQHDTLTNLQNQVIMFNRLYLPDPLFCQGTYCDCQYKTDLCSAAGTFHSALHCPKGGGHIKLHNDLISEFSNILRFAGIRHKVEPLISSFQVHDPNTRKRPDLVITDPNFIPGNIDFNMDFTILSCITRNPTMNSAKVHSTKLAELARHYKITKYHPCTVEPFPIIWPGFMDKITEAFLDKLCSYIKQLDSIPFNNIKQFILKRLSFVLLKGFANNVIYNHRRLYNSFSDPIRNQDFSSENIIESTDLNRIINNNKNHFISNHINTNKTVIPCITSYHYTSRVQIGNGISLVH